MIYETLTLVEASYVWMGLSIQQTLRLNPSLENLVPAIVIASILWLLLKRLTTANPEPLFSIGLYFVGVPKSGGIQAAQGSALSSSTRTFG